MPKVSHRSSSTADQSVFDLLAKLTVARKSCPSRPRSPVAAAYSIRSALSVSCSVLMSAATAFRLPSRSTMAGMLTVTSVIGFSGLIRLSVGRVDHFCLYNSNALSKGITLRHSTQSRNFCLMESPRATYLASVALSITFAVSRSFPSDDFHTNRFDRSR